MSIVLSVSSGCAREPCIPQAKYDFFARRAASGSDGGSCALQLSGTLISKTHTEASFEVNGFTGSCSVGEIDNRPEYACQVELTCTGTSDAGSVAWGAFSFVSPDPNRGFIDGYGGLPDDILIPVRWTETTATSCTSDYSWAAAEATR
ncbi:MAG: hypothetical protein JNM17_07215 [Archangium sp.]|nr:hypothetical protein [Archangium sp.]